jgi:4-amino-4-deoxychorismate lyase
VLEHEIAALAEGQQHCLVKAIITRGLATRRGYGPAGDERPTRIVSRYPWPPTSPPPPGPATPGFRVGISGIRLGLNPALAGLKHLNRLEQVLAQIALAEDGLDEVLMISSADRVISGSMSNVFFTDQSGLFTPALTDCGVAGVMRRLVLETAGRSGIQVQERAVACAELGAVRAAFVTNVRWGLQPVDTLAGRALERSDYVQQLWSLIDAPRG